MSSSVNRVILLGNVGKDPEFKSLQSGTAVANFSLATSERFKDRNGEQQERTEWHNCQAFERLAEVARDYVKKGSKLYVEGKIQTRSWDDQSTGEKKYRTEIIVRHISLLSGNGQQNGDGSSNDSQRSRQPSSSSGRASHEDYGETGITDDDIPF